MHHRKIHLLSVLTKLVYRFPVRTYSTCLEDNNNQKMQFREGLQEWVRPKNPPGQNEMLGAGECNTAHRIHSQGDDGGARPGDTPQSPK